MAKTHIHHTDFDYSPEKTTPVISSAPKFILPVPAFGDKGEDLKHPDGTYITDWEGKKIGDKGIVFPSGTDGADGKESLAAAPGDGTAIIIFNKPTPEKAKQLDDHIKTVVGDDRTIADLKLEEVKDIIRYARDKLGLTDVYNSNRTYAQEKLINHNKDLGIAAMDSEYGYRKADAKEIRQAFFVEGKNIDFVGTTAAAGGKQHFDGGMVVVMASDAKTGEPTFTGIGPKEFAETYKHPDKSPIKIEELAKQTPRKRAAAGPAAPAVAVSNRPARCNSAPPSGEVHAATAKRIQRSLSAPPDTSIKVR